VAIALLSALARARVGHELKRRCRQKGFEIVNPQFQKANKYAY
jgi:hypothetical protein